MQQLCYLKEMLKEWKRTGMAHGSQDESYVRVRDICLQYQHFKGSEAWPQQTSKQVRSPGLGLGFTKP